MAVAGDPMTRRTFLATAAAAGCASTPQMKLSMSVRVAESFSNKKESSLTIDELIALATAHGYEALCMRASTAGTHSPPQTISDYAARIAAGGLKQERVVPDDR